jgi:hypothetical protein
MRQHPSLKFALLAGVIGFAWEFLLSELAVAQLAPVSRTADVPLKDLAELILRSHRSERLPSRDGSLIAQVVVRQEGPAKRTVYVRRKQSGQIDIVFIVVTPSDETIYYQASVTGRLIQAAHGSMDPIANQDALNAFNRERDFWLTWAKQDYAGTLGFRDCAEKGCLASLLARV